MIKWRIGLTVVFFALLVVPGQVVAQCCAGGDAFPVCKDDPDSPVKLSLLSKGADCTDGIRLRAEIINRGSAPYSLSVCPAMLLCCVKGLHPLIAYDETGMGLMDLCTKPKPTPHEVLLPVNAAFAFDINIPIDRLPDACKEPGKAVQVKLCFELGEGKLVHSEAVKVSMAK